MEETINIYPVLATWKRSKKTGLCPLHLSVDIDHKRAAFPSLKRKIPPEQWDAEKRIVKSNYANAALLNAFISKKVKELDGEFLRKQLLGVKVTKQAAKKQVKGTNSGMDFYKFCNEQIENYPNKETRRTYKSEVTKLMCFSPSLSFNDIDYNFLQKYSRWMREIRGNEPNTIFKSFKFMHTMIEIAMKPSFKLVLSDPFAEFDRGKYEQGIPPYLEWAEVEKILAALREKKFADDHAIVGYYFLLSCFSGLRFGDCINFSYNKYVTTDSTGERLILSTEKSGEIVSIAFTEHIREVVTHIKERPLSLTNKAFNLILKVVGYSAGITKPLKSHMGRHTFAMRLAELGFSIDDAQKLLGHKDKKSTQIYFKIKNIRLDKEMEKWK